jgi:hypothetical protein
MAFRMKEFTINFDPESGGLRHETATLDRHGQFEKFTNLSNAYLKGTSSNIERSKQ